MTAGELIKKLEAFAPVDYACDWDNPGLLAGRRSREVKKVLVALDATDEVVEKAVSGGYDFLLTHHPLIFKPLAKVSEDSVIGRRVLTLIENGVTYYAMHTNFDSAPGGMGMLAAERMELSDVKPLEIMGETKEGVSYGVGAIGKLPYAMTLKELCEKAKAAFELPSLTVYRALSETEKIETLALCPGSGEDLIGEAVRQGAKVLLTGDIGHHEGIDAVAEGLTILDGGHYGLEHIFIPFMVEYIRKEMDGVQADGVEIKFPCTNF